MIYLNGRAKPLAEKSIWTSQALWASFGSQSSRRKRVFRAYLFGRSRLSAFSALNLHGRARQLAEKSISGFSDSVGELRLAEFSS
ncbi:hypothetical protein [Paenibacillus alginolyticus]|uniref:hypothetical protein n=1 Tax=Paenibacillus alginolyticus TaxID=59839 RepID=UPI00041FC35A|nr:hypothetical protein [Paenibacillus alginolyticus]